MKRFSITDSNKNKDEVYSKQQYLDMVGDFKSSYGDVILDEVDGRKVVRDDIIIGGTKARAGELLISKIKEDTIVYVQSRSDFAGIGLIELSKKYNKKLVFFMPSSKEVSDHQAYCIEQGCDHKFYRIAAMVNLNKAAQQWANENKAFFIPNGFNHELVTAMIISEASKIEEPKKFWTAFSTGMLNRALQIAWPNAEAHGLAISRNIQEGERGRANIVSSNQYLYMDALNPPPFPSVKNYDAKVWEFTKPGDLFWNVAGDISITIDKKSINSYRDWK